MRFIFFLLLTLPSFISIAQKVECRNDSIFINSFYINASTSKATIDNILKVTGKTKQQLGHYKPMTKERMRVTSYTYNKLGMIFRKYDYDSTKLSIVIKLSRNSNIATKLFMGDLYFANSHINEIKRLDQIQQLKDCKFKYYTQPVTVPGFPLAGAYAATITYQNSSLYVLSDFFIDEIVSVTIN
jgi:ascorbate-specific PTS system EIIC-type component UlaA